MRNTRTALPYLVTLLVLVWGLQRERQQIQTVHAQGTNADCTWTFTTTGNANSPGHSNASTGTPCVAFRITYSATGTLSFVVAFQTSPDNATFTSVPNTICSTSVQPPCVTEGANPTANAASGNVAVRAYGIWTRVAVTASSGTGTGTVTVYGYKGTSAAVGTGGGGGAAGATGATGPSGPSGPAGGAGVAGSTGATGPSGPSGAAGATGATGPGGTGLAAAGNLTAVTVSAAVATDQTLQEVALSAGFLNTLNAANIIHGSGRLTIGLAQTPILTWKIKLCTISGCGSGTVVTLANIVTGATVAATNNGWNLQVMAGTTATGASGTLFVHGAPGLTIDIGALPGSAATPFTDTNTAVSATINLTAALFIDFTVATSVGSGLNSFTQDIAEVLPQGAAAGGGGGSTNHLPVAFVSLPATCTSGDLYFINNSIYSSALCGAANSFTYYGPSGQMSPPPSTGWTWDNQGASIIDSTNGYEYLSVPQSGVLSATVRYRTAPAAPYTVTAQFLHDLTGMPPGAHADNNAGYGLVFRDGTGKLVTWMVLYGTNYNAETDKWTTSTLYSANYKVVNNALSNADMVLRHPAYLRIADDNTNLTFSWSIDGQHWKLFDSHPRTDFLAAGPTQIGFWAYPQGNAVELALISWTAQ